MNFWKNILLLFLKRGRVNQFTFKEETYKGIDENDIPIRIYHSKKYTHKSAILFLGASPDGEKHKSLNFLAKILTHFGYNVFIPRIPPLMQLNISNINVNWMEHIYNDIKRRPDVNKKYIAAVGISYGGGMLLKASLSKTFMDDPPKTFFLYGAGCNVDTVLKFITKGEFDYNENSIKMKPHDWGLTVFFHHFMDEIEFGFDKTKIKEVIRLRIQNKKQEANEKLKLLKGDEFSITNSIISGNITKDVLDLVDKTINKKKHYIDELSCKPICHKIGPKTFIFHGANDNMVPFSESVQLNQLIPGSELLISYLFEHKGISSKSNIFKKLKEFIRLINFFKKFDSFHAS